MKAHSGHLVDRPHLYWPGLQGLVANPMAWRERLSTTSEFLFIDFIHTFLGVTMGYLLKLCRFGKMTYIAWSFGQYGVNFFNTIYLKGNRFRKYVVRGAMGISRNLVRKMLDI